MTRALIGSTGFVGSSLLRSDSFADCYHSTDIETIRGRSYEMIVCAGAPGTKWRANQEPEADRAAIDKLTRCLEEVVARHVVLISTVDVYPDPRGVDEDSPIDESSLHPYGRHRLALERFIADRFASTVLRLPALFGPGLKKNVIYDFLHDNHLDRVDARSRFQFYDLDWLPRDIDRVRESGIGLVNIATEPLSVREVAAEAFGLTFANEPGAPANYDFQSRHAVTLGGRRRYLYGRAAVLAALRRFVATCGWERR